MQIIGVKATLTPEGWKSNVRIVEDETGTISAVDANSHPEGFRVGIAMRVPGNLHSHGFQRALTGLIEIRSQKGTDSFWTWRKLIDEFIDQLIPEEIETITTYGQPAVMPSGKDTTSIVSRFRNSISRPRIESWSG